MRTQHVFSRIDEYDFEEFVRIALPALERVDPVGLLDLLSRKLERALKAAFDPEDFYPGQTTTWVRDLDQPDPIDGVVAQLARAVCAVAVRSATNQENTEKVLSVLDRHQHEIFHRIRLRILAAAGQYVRDKVDAFLTSSAALEPDFRGRETAALIREQFDNASSSSREVFRRALEAGPSDLQNKMPDQADAAENAEKLADWQRRRLRWFRDRLPDSLREIAARLGVPAQRHTPAEEGLAEDGIYISGGFFSPSSAVSASQLQELDEEAFADFVLTWLSDGSTDGLPLLDGLSKGLSQYASENPDAAVARAILLNDRLDATNPKSAEHVQALIAGLSAAAMRGKRLNWNAILPLLSELWGRVDALGAKEDRGNVVRPWQSLGIEILGLMIEACRHNAFEASEFSAVWQIVGRALGSSRSWDSNSDAVESFEDVLFEALNAPAGRATEVCLELACAAFRSYLGSTEDEATTEQRLAAAKRVAPQLELALEQVLSYEGRPAIAARAVLGTYLPQIHLLNREWLLRSAHRILEGGSTNPLKSPVWGAYLTRAQLYRDVFRDLKPWYLRAAKDLPAIAGSPGKHEQFSVRQHLATHVFDAYMQGLVDTADDDHLMSTMFGNLFAEERAHVYWQIFRTWTDAKESPSAALVERLLRFWQWRLESLSNSPDGEAKQQDLAGLTWLFCTPHVPDKAALELGSYTLEMSGGGASATPSAVWERLETVAGSDISKGFRMADLLIRSTLAKTRPYLSLKRTQGVLSRAVQAGDPETCERAITLIHFLGDRGYVEFGGLLDTSSGTGDKG